MADFEPYRGGGMDPLQMFMQLQQLKASREQQEQRSREEGVNLGLKLAGMQDPKEFEATVRYLQQARNIGPGEADFLRGTNATAAKQRKLAEARENLPTLAAAGTPALAEGGGTQYAPLQQEGFAALLKQLATTLPPDAYAGLVAEASGMIGAGTGQQGRQVATEGRQEAQSVRAGQRAEGRAIRAEGRNEARQRRLLDAQAAAGRTEFERLNAIPEDQRSPLVRARLQKLTSKSAEGMSFTSADGTVLLTGDAALRKQDQDLIDAHAAAIETDVDLGKLISIAERDPTVLGAVGQARNLSSRIVGLFTDAGQAQTGEAFQTFITDSLGAAASDPNAPEAIRDRAQGLLVDPATRGTLEALNFALTYSQVRASRTGRPSERDFERAQKAIGIGGFRDASQVLETLKEVQRLNKRKLRATKLQVERTPNISQLSADQAAAIRGSGPESGGAAPSVTGIDFEYDPETGQFREVGQ